MSVQPSAVRGALGVVLAALVLLMILANASCVPWGGSTVCRPVQGPGGPDGTNPCRARP